MAREAVGDLDPILGFGSALFGMREPAIRQAIAEDFGISGDAVAVSRHRHEQTTLLTIDVDGLLEIAGAARVVYVLGYTSSRLIRVDLEWQPIDGIDADLSSLAKRVIGDLPHRTRAPVGPVHEWLAGDGVQLLFVGEDGFGRRVIVTVMPVSAAGAPGSMIRRSHVADPADPDIYQIPPGAF